jgi:thioredoxin 1
MLAPVLDELSKEQTDAQIAKVDVDTEGPIAQEFGVMSITTMIMFKDGVEVSRQTGALPKEIILK